MNQIILTLGWISFFFAMLSYVCGAIGIVRGPAHPSMISRFFWLILSITNLLSYYKMGAGSGIFLALAGTIGSAVIFLLSLRYGYIEFKRSDVVAIVGACIALICYLMIPIKLVALSTGLLTHFISGIPTYKKTWRNPYAENLSFWFLFALASAFSLVAVLLQNKNMLYPVYFLLFDSGMTLLIIMKRYSFVAVEAA
ncbi:MAG: hypothetical protein P4M14_12165 [Gammaproteobacteria bacterium]|nr:hypothetical protein [Gammaproteobacteria bacterium]